MVGKNQPLSQLLLAYRGFDLEVGPEPEVQLTIVVQFVTGYGSSFLEQIKEQPHFHLALSPSGSKSEFASGLDQILSSRF